MSKSKSIKIKYPDGRTYSGLGNGKTMNGIGILYYSETHFYEGQFNQNMKSQGFE